MVRRGLARAVCAHESYASGYTKRLARRIRTAPEAVVVASELGARRGGEEAGDGGDVDDASGLEGRRVLREQLRQAARRHVSVRHRRRMQGPSMALTRPSLVELG